MVYRLSYIFRAKKRIFGNIKNKIKNVVPQNSKALFGWVENREEIKKMREKKEGNVVWLKK